MGEGMRSSCFVPDVCLETTLVGDLETDICLFPETDLVTGACIFTLEGDLDVYTTVFLMELLRSGLVISVPY